MLTSRRKAGIFGIVSFPDLFFLFSLLLFVNSVTAAPLQLRRSSGPTFCDVPLKANSYYRNVCLGLLDPQTGSKIQTLPQPGVTSIGNNLLRWQTSKDMDGILNNRLVDRSGIHCDQSVRPCLQAETCWLSCSSCQSSAFLFFVPASLRSRA